MFHNIFTCYIVCIKNFWMLPKKFVFPKHKLLLWTRYPVILFHFSYFTSFLTSRKFLGYLNLHDTAKERVDLCLFQQQSFLKLQLIVWLLIQSKYLHRFAWYTHCGIAWYTMHPTEASFVSSELISACLFAVFNRNSSILTVKTMSSSNCTTVPLLPPVRHW